MGLWIYRHTLIIAVAEKNAIGNAAKAITGKLADAGIQTVQLSTTGNAPVTHWGSSGATTEAIRSAMEAVLGSFTTLNFWRMDINTNVLQLTNCAASQGRVGQVITWQDCLTDVGLQVIGG